MQSVLFPILLFAVFILIGVAVAIMEMRDMTAKVFPLTKRTAPRRRTTRESSRQSGVSANNKLMTPEALGNMFQTPAQRVAKELEASRLENRRSVATQTVPLQRWWHSPREYLLRRLSTRRCRSSLAAGAASMAVPAKPSPNSAWRSCHLFSVAPANKAGFNGRGAVALRPPSSAGYVHKRSSQRRQRRLVVHSMQHSTSISSVSCPHINFIS